MGNRTGSPPEQYRDDEDEGALENQSETDDTQQTEIDDVTQSERNDEERSNNDPDVANDPDESYEGDFNSGGVIDTPTKSEPDGTPQEDDESDEIEQGDEHPGAEDGSGPESDSEKRDSTDDELDEFEFIYGDIVQDREAEQLEDEGLEDLVVVNLPCNTIANWDCDGDKTLADRNTGYPPVDSVVIVVTLEALSAKMPEWDKRHEDIPLETLEDNSIDYSCYPSLRLELEEPSHLRTL